MAGGHPNSGGRQHHRNAGQRTGRPARIDSYDNVAGPIAARVRAVGVRAAVAVPIIVDGRVWGLAAVGSMQPARCRPTPRSTSAASPN